MQYVWYFCGKALVAHGLLKRGYNSASIKKKILMSLTFPLFFKPLHDFLYSFVKSYNNIEATYLGGFALVSRFKNTITPQKIWGRPKNIDFELTELLAPTDIDAFLKFYFGNYMKWPAIEERTSRHMLEVDFGQY